MTDAANPDWPMGRIVAVRHARQGGGLRSDIPPKAQDRIGTALRAMYADLLQQPLSPSLAALVRVIEAQREASRHGG